MLQKKQIGESEMIRLRGPVMRCASVDVHEADHEGDLESDTRLKFVVRSAEQDEAMEVAELMAKAFHTPASIQIIDKAKYALFKAEVVDSILTKFKYTNEDEFVCLVAQLESGELCGAVEISQQNFQDVQKVSGHPKQKQGF